MVKTACERELTSLRRVAAVVRALWAAGPPSVVNPKALHDAIKARGAPLAGFGNFAQHDAQAFLLAEKFISGEDVTLILGDNIFYGDYFQGESGFARAVADFAGGALIFGYYVSNPQDFGVIEFDERGRAVGIEEKPVAPKSSFAVPGLYVYDREVVKICKELSPSARGELEITTLLESYLHDGLLSVKRMGRGYAWLDTGTHETMLQAAHYIETIETRQGLKIACLEEIAWRSGYIDVDKFKHLADGYPESSYGRYLKTLAQTALT